VAALEERDPFRSALSRERAARMGMWLFVLVVVLLFAAALLGYGVVRLSPTGGREWRPEGTPMLPWTLLASTAALLASSVALHRSLVAVRQGRMLACTRGATAAYWLGVAFVVLQGLAWWTLWQQVRMQDNLYAWTFYFLTALHVFHVLGGLYALGVVAARAQAGQYRRDSHNGIVLCSIYWHSLDAIWLVLYATLWIGSR
jgi:heme/copper-type cytochrome/quinol oxidase subunit 3